MTTAVSAPILAKELEIQKTQLHSQCGGITRPTARSGSTSKTLTDVKQNNWSKIRMHIKSVSRTC